MGYTPVFDTVLDGTLCGKWPHTGIWLCLLSQCDRNGNIDQVPQLLAAKIGVPVDQLLQCIHDFMQPDPGSRTGDMDGRRLELMDGPDASREWGWRVINHSLYREKARKKSYDDARTSSGADAARKLENRQSRDVPTRPALSRSHTHTQTPNTKHQTEEKDRGNRASRACRIPEDFQLTDDRKAVAEREHVDAARTFATFTDYWRGVSGEKARKHDWDATWRNWCRRQGDQATKADRPRKTRYDQIMEMRHAKQAG